MIYRRALGYLCFTTMYLILHKLIAFREPLLVLLNCFLNQVRTGMFYSLRENLPRETSLYEAKDLFMRSIETISAMSRSFRRRYRDKQKAERFNAARADSTIDNGESS